MKTTTRRSFLNTTVAFAGAAAVFSGEPGRAQEAAWSGQLNWPANCALPRFAEPVHLDAADISKLPGDQQTVLVTLQGIVNRAQPRLYWVMSGDGTDLTWLGTLSIPNRVTSDPWSLFAKYRNEIRGAIVYDTNVPDSINVATSLASLHDAVIATPELANSLKLPVLEDLRGRFKDKFGAYDWLLSNYWDRLTHRIVSAIGPSNTVQVPGVQWETLLQVTGHVHDASNKGTYTADLSSLLAGGSGTVYVRYQDAFSNDGWGPSVQQVTVLADGNAIASFQPGTDAETPFLYDPDSSQLASAWRFADGTNYFIYAFTPPAGTKTLTLQTLMWNQYLVTATNTAPEAQVANPEFRDYIVATGALVFWLDPLVPAEATLFGQILGKVAPDALYLGWFPHGNETPGVTLCAQYGVAVAATDDFNNGTVFGGVRARVASMQPSATTPQIANKIYVTLTMSEGDNVQYDQHRMRMIWDDPNRGQAPINWSVSPLLLDAGPSMLSYYQRTQTDNDLLVAGPSGAGYTYPGEWPPADLSRYTERTGRYMRRTGMNIIYALNRDNNTDLPLTQNVAAAYVRDVNPLGILYNWEATSQLSVVDGLPVFTQIGISSVSDGQTALTNALNGWDGKSPLFVALGVLAWNMAPADVNTLVNSLSSQFEVVRGDVFFKLLKQSMQPAKT